MELQTFKILIHNMFMHYCIDPKNHFHLLFHYKKIFSLWSISYECATKSSCRRFINVGTTFYSNRISVWWILPKSLSSYRICCRIVTSSSMHAFYGIPNFNQKISNVLSWLSCSLKKYSNRFHSIYWSSNLISSTLSK